ncbi:MAG: stage sporulation protein [Paenibacillaceae bacterium]|nr:stage sporulation protein [Paenibacillaceae bacterium]
MNTKRQTIWLVSMLSLMVVLSAYYLFTEDVNKLNTATEKVTQEDIKVTTEQKDPVSQEKAVSGGLTAGTSEKSSDAKVLEQVQSVAKSGSDYFADLAYKRNQDMGLKAEGFLNIIVDTKKSTDEISKATDEFEKLQTMQAKVENLEDLLGQTYSNAIVLAEDNKYKALVQVAGKLDAKQAQGIIDMMIKELGVVKDNVSVQYMN